MEDIKKYGKAKIIVEKLPEFKYAEKFYDINSGYSTIIGGGLSHACSPGCYQDDSGNHCELDYFDDKKSRIVYGFEYVNYLKSIDYPLTECFYKYKNHL